KKSSDEAKLPNIVLGLGAGSGIYENSSGIPNRIYELESEPNAASFQWYAIVKYYSFSFVGSEITYNVYKNDYVSTGLVGWLYNGYDVKPEKMKEGYKTIHERELSHMAGLTVTLPLGQKYVEPYVALVGGPKGAQLRGTLSFPYSPFRGLYFTPYITGKFYTDEFSNYYFGVTESELGEKLTSTYELNSGYELIGGLNIMAFVNENLGFNLSGRALAFSNEIKDSPIVRDQSYTTTFSFSMFYNFYF
ncbi:MAG: MipA/OmpV family protein, partial [Fusobacteriaceae bacterium]